MMRMRNGIRSERYAEMTHNTTQEVRMYCKIRVYMESERTNAADPLGLSTYRVRKVAPLQQSEWPRKRYEM